MHNETHLSEVVVCLIVCLFFVRHKDWKSIMIMSEARGRLIATKKLHLSDHQALTRSQSAGSRGRCLLLKIDTSLEGSRRLPPNNDKRSPASCVTCWATKQMSSWCHLQKNPFSALSGLRVKWHKWRPRSEVQRTVGTQDRPSLLMPQNVTQSSSVDYVVYSLLPPSCRRNTNCELG